MTWEACTESAAWMERNVCKYCGCNLRPVRDGYDTDQCWQCRNGGETLKIGSAFSAYLKQDDIGTARPTVTIASVQVEEVGTDDKPEKKPVLYFKGKEKGLILNKTNAEAITEIMGTDETDHWQGRQIVLYVDHSVMYAGKKVGGVRVASPGAPAQPAPPPPVTGDEDVPF